MHARRFSTIFIALALVALGIAGCETSDSGSKTSAQESKSQPSEEESEAEQSESADATNAQSATEGDSEKAEADSEGEQRDVELSLPDQATPFDGIITAGQPSKEQFDKLDDAGVSHVINFRTSDEAGVWDEKTRAEELGIGYTQIPIGSAEDLSRENVEAFHEALESSEGDVLVHCGSSKRVGAMFALRAFWIQGEGVDTALEIGRKAGMASLEDAVEEKIQ